MFALLPVHKPKGLNSRKIVDALELSTGQKVGHAGTLDPLASGVLLTAIGPATRLIPYAQRMAKRYTACFELGLESDSGDTERECRLVPVQNIPTEDDLSASIQRWIGTIVQTPPLFSAVRIDGRRAYRLAHRGRVFTVPQRNVTVYSIRLLRYTFPIFEIDVVCGSGTYVRSLGQDIAAGVAAKCVMLELCRDAIGPFELNRCATMEDIQSGALCPKLVDPLALLDDLPILELCEDELEPLARGVKLEYERREGQAEMAVIDAQRRLHAIVRPAPDGKWKPSLNFSKYWRGEVATRSV